MEVGFLLSPPLLRFRKKYLPKRVKEGLPRSHFYIGAGIIRYLLSPSVNNYYLSIENKFKT